MTACIVHVGIAIIIVKEVGGIWLKPGSVAACGAHRSTIAIVLISYYTGIFRYFLCTKKTIVWFVSKMWVWNCKGSFWELKFCSFASPDDFLKRVMYARVSTIRSFLSHCILLEQALLKYKALKTYTTSSLNLWSSVLTPSERTFSISLIHR